MAFDLSRLKSNLLVSGLQQKDPVLYQVINQLIGQIEALGILINNLNLSNNQTLNIIINQLAGLGSSPSVMDGQEGDIGPQGPQGIQGLIGPQGFVIPGIDGDNGLDGISIPGQQGLQGIIGLQGPPGIDGEDGRDGIDSSPISYSEGTWIPNVTFATPGDVAVSYITQVADYVKIGRFIFARFIIVTNTFTWLTAAGNLLVTGLPFANSNIVGFNVNANLVYDNIILTAGYTQVSARIGVNTTSITFTQTGSTLGNLLVTTANLVSGQTLRLVSGICYRID